MGSFWDEISKDRDRKRREQRSTDAWLRREAEADAKRTMKAVAGAAGASRAEDARQAREAGEAEASARNAALAARIAALADVLPAVVVLPPRTLEMLRQDAPILEFEPPAPDPAQRRPAWTNYAPPEPGVFGRRKYERAVNDARAAFRQASQDFDRSQNDRLVAARRAHDAEQTLMLEQHQRRWRELSDAVECRDPDAVAEFVGAIAHALPPLSGLLSGGRAAYQAEPREVVVEIDLPDVDIIPAERSWRYVQARRAIEASPRPARDAADLYVDLVSRITLAMMHGCFRALDGELLDLVTLNGHVPTIDPATGRPAHPCVITVTASRGIFERLVLDNDRLDPSKCLKSLGAALSPHPYELEAIPPFIDFDLVKYRLVTSAEALVALDSSADLLKMNAYDFERLVKDLLTKMGYETWRTTSSRDDGIDAIATRADPIFPVECVIQAKRFSKAVPPKEVQALMGAMAESGTATHGVLVTTSWLIDRSRQRARAQRIITIERNELVYLIEQHLDRKVVISNQLPRR